MSSRALPISQDTEQFYLSVMKEAQVLAWQKSSQVGGKLSTTFRETGRKQLKNLPVTAIKAVVGHIPFVGGVASAGVNFLANKIRDGRVANQALAAIMPKGGARSAEEGDAPVAAGRSSDVKVLAKDLQLIAQNFDRNVLKFTAELEAVRNKLNQLAAAPTSTYQVWMQRYSEVAYHYFRLLHYTEKLAGYRDQMEERLSICSQYVEAIDKWSVGLEEILKEAFVAGAEAIDDPKGPLLRGRSGSSSS